MGGPQVALAKTFGREPASAHQLLSLFALGPEFYTATIHLTPILFIHSSTHITAIAEPPVFSLTFSFTLPQISKYISSTQKESIGFSETSQEHIP